MCIDTIIASASGLIGVILGWILNTLSNSGKLYIYNKQWNGLIEKARDEYGNLLVRGNPDSYERISFNTEMDVFNNSTENRIMRNIRVGFYCDNNLLLSTTAMDLGTVHQTNSGHTINKTDFFNIPAKTTVRLSLIGNDEIEKAKDISRTNKAHLFYLNEKNREKKIEIPIQTFFSR